MLNNNEKKLSLNCDGQQIPPLSIKLIIKWIMVSTIYIFFKVITFVGWFIYGVLRHFQHYFINQSINSISVILVAETRTTRRKPPTCHKSLTNNQIHLSHPTTEHTKDHDICACPDSHFDFFITMHLINIPVKTGSYLHIGFREDVF